MAFEHHSHLSSERRLELQVRLVALLAFAPIIVLPFLHNLGVSRLWSYPKLVALQAAAVTAWAGLLIVRPSRFEQILRSSGVGPPMVLLLGWGALSAAWSGARWTAAQPLVELGYMALALTGFAYLLTSTTIRKWFLTAYGLAAGGACLAYVICYPLSGTHMKVYPFGNPNVAAAFAILPLAVGAAYAISAAAGRVPVRVGLIGGTVALASGAAVVVSRSAAGGMSAAGALVLVAVFSFRGRLRRRLLEVLCSVGLLILLWPLLAPGLWPERWIREHAGPRPAIWQGAAELAGERPLFGLGLGSFFVEYARVHPLDYAAHRQKSAMVENAHCVPVHVVIELGLVGVALAAWLVYRAVRNARQATRRAGHFERAMLRGLVCGGIGMLTQGLVSTSLHQPECSINLVLALALIGGAASVWWRRNVPGRKRALFLRVLPVLLLAAVFLMTAAPGAISQFHMHRAWTTQADQPAPRIRSLRKAIAATWPTRATLEARIKLADVYQQTGHLREALDHLHAVNVLAPNFGKSKRHQADLLLRLGRIEQASNAIWAYCRKDPFDPTAQALWVDILKEATRQQKPYAARPREAVKLLTIAADHRTRAFRFADARRLQGIRRIFTEAMETDRPGPGATPAGAPTGSPARHSSLTTK